jgi:hypothetical protein
MKIHRSICGFLAASFVGFAYLQLNDPDPIIWVPAYLFSTLTGGLVATGIHMNVRRLLYIALGGYTVWILTMVPDLLHWINLGMPKITGAMQAKKPYIEVIREMGGLGIALVANIYFLVVHKKQHA